MKPSLQKIYIDKTQSVEDALKWFNNNLGVRKEQKDKNGEVFTPHSLIKEMLDQFPKSVWKNKDLKWLDPAAGYGQFMFEVVRRLMDGLKDEIKQPKQRLKHILTKQIYQVEFNPISSHIIRGIYGFDGVSSNVFTGSFVPGDYKRVFEKFEDGTDTFDCIIGNPPYNKGQTSSGKKGGGDDLWSYFVKRSLGGMLKDRGYLCYVHPSAWRKPQSSKSKGQDLYELMTSKNHMCNLQIHDTNDGKITFNVGTRYDFYLIKKANGVGKSTTVNDQDRIQNSFILSSFDFLPNSKYDLINTLLRKDDEEHSPVLFSRSKYGSDKQHTSKTKTRYPLIHSITKKDGIIYYYSKYIRSDVEPQMFGVSKVIIGDNTGLSDVIIDMDGKYGMTQHAIGIKVSNLKEAEELKKAFLSDIMQEIAKSLSFSNYQIDWRIFCYFIKDWYKVVLEEQRKKDEATQVDSSGESSKAASGGKRRKSHRRRSRSRKSVSKRQRRMYSKKRSKIT